MTQGENESLLPGQLNPASWKPPEEVAVQPPSPLESTQLHVPPPSVPLESVLGWLLTATAEEVQPVLARVKQQRPELFDLPPSGAAATSSELLSPEAKDMMRNKRHLETIAACRELPIVQFVGFESFCEESERSVKLDVMRIGDVTRTSEVRYRTVDGSAIAGKQYEATEGKLIFKKGEVETSIQIPLLCDPTWDTTTDFLVELDAKTAVDCTLGRYLWQTCVKVADKDCFPSSKYKRLIDAHAIEEIPKWGLLREYLKLNWLNSVVKKGTIKMFICDFLHNGYFFSNLCMNVYLVDQVLKGDLEDPLPPLIKVAASLVGPLMLLHVLDYRRNLWKVGGTSRKTLQTALMRKFLNYSEESRSQINRSDLAMAMSVHVPDLVDNGYVRMIGLVKLCGQVFFILLFQVLAPIVFDKDFNRIPFIVIVAFPLLQFAFVRLRREQTVHAVSVTRCKQAALVEEVDRTVTNYRLIADYNRRGFCEKGVQEAVGGFNKAAVQKALVMRNNAYFPQWISILSVALYIIIGGKQVIDEPEHLSLGMFLANVSIIKTIGGVMASIYGHLIGMQQAFAALISIVSLMNMPLDIPQRMDLTRGRRNTTIDMRSHLRQTSAADMVGFPLDNVPIIMDNVTYSYGADKVAETLQLHGKLEIQQGEMVGLIGPLGQGKTTLLHLLANVILPKPGGLFVPTHLRTLNVPPDPYFFKGSLYANLCFGVTSGEGDANISRVRKIVSDLGLSETVLKFLDEGSENTSSWAEVLSYTQQRLLCLARAFVANPELLFADKPTMPFNVGQASNVTRMFRKFCDEKGIEQDASRSHQRRPRTCVITNSHLICMDLYEQVYMVDRRGVTKLGIHEVRSDLLD